MYPLEKFIGKHMPNAPIIIEAGTHDARDTLYMNHLWPQAKIYTFEPNPYWHETIRKRIAPYPNISFYPVALGDKLGSADFYEFLSNKGGGDCTLKPILTDSFWIDMPESGSFAEPIQVPMVTLDFWGFEHSIDHIDFMWLDMEGAEGKMFLGSEELLKKTRIIQTEWSERALFEGEMSFAELNHFLTERGFVCGSFIKNRPEEIRGDALFFKVSAYTENGNF